jgi:hypothetical protein
MPPRRFPILFDTWYAVLSSALLLPPAKAYVEIDAEQVRVRMGWAFRSRFPKTAVALAEATPERPLSRGVHGFAGKWLVNGAGRGMLTIRLTPDQRGYVMGFPVSLRQLMLSVAEPSALAAALMERA